MSSYTTISSDKLSRLIGTANAATLIDVRIDDDFAADPCLIPGASRRSHRDIQDWAGGLAGQSVVVICQKGQKLSEGTAAWLRHNSIAAETLEGGQVGWTQMELPTVPADKIPKRDARGRTVWVTRSRPKIDRIACPWLIRRFIDPSAVSCSSRPPRSARSPSASKPRRSTWRTCSGVIAASSAPSTSWCRNSACRRRRSIGSPPRRRNCAARPFAGGAGAARRVARPVADV